MSWLGKQEQFQSQVLESRSILESRDGYSLERLLRNLSGFVLLTPFALVALVAMGRDDRDRDARWAIAIWT